MLTIKGTHDPREEFAIAVGSILLAPLAPIIIEWGFSGKVGTSSILISSLMYVASLAFSTDKKFIFWAGFIAVGYLALMYGAHVKTDVNVASLTNLPADLQDTIESWRDQGDAVYNSAIILMVSFGIAHFFQRARMHLKDAEPFLEFRTNKINQKNPERQN